MDNKNENIKPERPATEPSRKGLSMVRTVFGVIMIIVFVGMGIFFLFDPFGMSGHFQYGWFHRVFGGVLIVYGIFRAYRQFAGIDYNPADNEE